MGHTVFQPKTAVREEKRQANEALGRSFCKSIAEPVTNSDSSAKRKHNIRHASGLIDLMMAVPKGSQMDTAALRAQLKGKSPRRAIVVELATAKASGRPVGEVIVVDQAAGMSTATLRQALDDIGGNKLHLSDGVTGRNLFGRGLSDVMRAHSQAIIHTFDGKQLTVARGEWPKGKGAWTIEMDNFDTPSKSAFRGTFLDPGETGTAVRFVIADRKRCHIPDPPEIAYRLANFYMLRLIASDPNVELLLRQHRAAGLKEERIEYDFPVGPVIESFSRTFDPPKSGLKVGPLKVDFLVVRSESEHGLRVLGLDRDGRENGMLIVDELDAVYDLTFADPDYERADFLSRVYGVVRVNGLRKVLESYLESEAPTSALRPDRDGFNRDHEFARPLLEFITGCLRPIYEKERKRLEAQERGELSSETKRRIDDALKHLNKYFQRITELSGDGTGTGTEEVAEPNEPVVFSPQRTRLIAGHSRQVLLLVREDAVKDGAEVVTSASEGFTVQPETERIQEKTCPRWQAHKHFFALRFSVSCSEIGKEGLIVAMVEGAEGSLIEAKLQIDDVLAETVIEVPETFEFRPAIATGRPMRRNNLVLYLNPHVISPGHHVRVEITKRTGNVLLIGQSGAPCEQVDVKLDADIHEVEGQEVLRVLIPWSGTSWNQHARVQARTKVGGEHPLVAEAGIRLDEPEEAGFFKDVKYGEIDPKAPSQYAAGVVTVNINDLLNRLVFGDSKEEFDKRVSASIESQQRLAALLLEEASFKALQQRYEDDKVLLAHRKEIDGVHMEVDKYKFESAVDVYRALARKRS
jgi:hypothetical protein